MEKHSWTSVPCPLAGDIGEPLKHIELEPLEAPVEVPVPQEVPSR